MSEITFVIRADSPEQAVAAIRTEVQRRQQIAARRPAARTQKEEARRAGELAALDSMFWLLSRTTFEPAADRPEDHRNETGEL